MQIVPVVPDDDQAEVADRREHGGAGAHHDLHGPAADGQESAVPFGRAEVGAQRDTARRAGDIPHCGHDTVDVPMIGHDDQGTPVGSDCGGHGRGHHRRPGRPGKCPPHRSGAATGGQVAQQPFALGVLRPGASRHVSGRHVSNWHVSSWRRLLLHPGVPGRDGETEHVGEGPGVAVGHRPSQFRDLRREDRLRRHHAGQERERAGVVRPLAPAQDEPVDEPTGEADPDPRAGNGCLRPLRRHQVVEQPIQVGR